MTTDTAVSAGTDPDPATRSTAPISSTSIPIPAAAPAVTPAAVTPAAVPATLDELVTAATEHARDHLLALQDEQGWWKGELETNVSIDAENILLRRFFGILTDTELAEAARWIRSKQRADGTWASFYGGPADLSVTFEAYVALRVAGDAADDAHMRAAASFIRQCGGLARTRVFTRIWMALFGLWSWDDLPVLPPELILLPSWFPLNIYDFGCWARQTVVPLTLVGSIRPSRPLGVTLDELAVQAAPVPPSPLLSWSGVFERLDRVLHRYERRPLRVLRRFAVSRATEWVLARQEADGCWGGIQPPWVYSMIALHLGGYSLDHPVIVAGLRGLERYTVREDTPDGTVRRIEACQSPVWDTALAVVALRDAGVASDHPAMVRAARWLADEEITVAGDWAVRRPALAPAGWAFEFDNDLYPDVDDTAEVVLAIERLVGPSSGSGSDSGSGSGVGPGSADGSGSSVGDGDGVGVGVGDGGASGGLAAVDPELAARLRAASDRGAHWATEMRSADGGWAAFDADNTRTLPTKLPFCDFGEVIDPPSADVTAHMVEMLAELGRADDPITVRGVRWLLDNQEPGGSWFGRWGVNHVYGTGAVVPALIAAGIPADHPAIRRAVGWLVDHQRPDGGWGEDLRSYRDEAWIGRGEPTASQTGWALLALLAADPGIPAVERGVRWLAETQRADGTWDEPYFTGTGFPWDFSLNYHLYRLVFPLTALGRFGHYLRGGSGS
jgi:squalene-hopene/tetraprenyl-beta-curcumene cyclase